MNTSENLWKEFDGLKNSDDVVVEKAQALWKFLVSLVLYSVDAFFESQKDSFDKKLIDDKYYEVAIEVSVFYLHFVDRIAFESLELKQRDIFMNIVVRETAKALFGIFSELGVDTKEADFHATFLFLYKERQKEYIKYKELFAKGDEGMANTLFWEFGKKISEILTGEKSDMLINMSVLQFITGPLVKVLELPKLFGGPKSQGL